jgi:hypothetical protein
MTESGQIRLIASARTNQPLSFFLLALPSAIAVAFLLIADLDSPRGGLIHVSWEFAEFI